MIRPYILGQKEASEEFDLDLEDLSTNNKKGGKKRPQMKRKPIKPPGTNSANVDSAQKGFDGVPLNGNGYDMQQQYLQPQQHQFQQQFFPQQQQQQQSYQYPQQQQFDQQPFYQQVRVV